MASQVQPLAEIPKPLNQNAEPFNPTFICKPKNLPHPQLTYQQPSPPPPPPLLPLLAHPLPPSPAMFVMGMPVERGLLCFRSNGHLYQHLYYQHHHQFQPLPLLEYAGFDVCNPWLLDSPLKSSNIICAENIGGEEEKVSMDVEVVKNIDTGSVGKKFKKKDINCCSMKRTVTSVERKIPRKLKDRGAVCWVPKKTDHSHKQQRGSEGAILNHAVQEVRHRPPVGARGETTFMVRNIPNRLRREELLEILDQHCRQENEKAKYRSDPVRSAYDFVYLPIDFKLLGNKGYAFVNFTTSVAAARFRRAMNKSRWNDCFESRKKCAFSVARIQGQEALVKHFEASKFPTNTCAFLPVVLSPPRDGSYPRTSPRVVGKYVSSGTGNESIMG